MSIIVVLDTNILVSAMMGIGPAHQAMTACLKQQATPLIGSALLAEYESLLHRPELEQRYLLSPEKREMLLDDFLAVCRWQPVYFIWRPNLPDEADNHVLELALAGGSEVIVTQNIRDFQRGELCFPHLRVLQPENWLEELRYDHNDR
jgi:putative PIN family toxin of toxin-antitoxin system